MKIFSTNQIRKADAFTIENEPVSSVNLMERAASACVIHLKKNSKQNQTFAVFCGPGNNGGDGFAIARLLYLDGFDVTVFTDLKNTDHMSHDAKVNFERLKPVSGIDLLDFEDAKQFDFSKVVIIDALFGTGLSRNLEGKYESIVKILNGISAWKVAVDIPSGLSADHKLDENSTIFSADETLSFQFWKKSFLHPETGKFCGKVHILDIDLSSTYINETQTGQLIVCDNIIKNIYKPRPDFSHKGNFGKTCIIAGSFGKMGAAVLATRAALRSGSGLTYALAPKCGYEIMQTACPEAMYLYGGEDFVSVFEVEKDFVCGIGPGLGTDPETEENFLSFIKNHDQPVVLDADALNLIAKNPEFLTFIPLNSIITPHPKEFERLFGSSADSFERLARAKQISERHQIYIVLKDHHTQIITPEGKVYYNITGNSGMAKGGSGDVLTGIITSLLAQHYTAEEAAVFGVWLHGKAGDFALEKFSRESLLATDLIEHIPEVFRSLER